MKDAALAAFVEEVADSGPVAVEGRRTRWSAGGPLAYDARVLSAPCGILEHRPSEMTVRVLAGTSVAELDAALQLNRQQCALPDRGGTVGGAVAVGENHLDVATRGAVRASVLQLRYVAADGRLITGGGPTVKNVTGFDLPRLMVGALGTLGLIGEVLLRTNPLPEASLWVRACGVDPFPLVTALQRRATILWDGTDTWIHLQGHAADVAASRVELPGRLEEVDGPPDLPAMRTSLRPSDVRQLPGRTGTPFVASVGVGTAFLTERPPVPRRDEAAALLAARAKLLFDPTGRLNPGRTP